MDGFLKWIKPQKHLTLLVKSGLIASCLIWSNAFAGSSFSEFSSAIQIINNSFLDYCRDNAESVLNTQNILGPLNEGDIFRQACGQGIADKPLPYISYKVIYYRQFDADNALDFLGLQRDYIFDAKSFKLVVGQAFRINKIDPAKPIKQVAPEAYLFVEENKRWIKAWQFASALSTDWHLPNAAFPERQNISQKYSVFLHKVWSEGIQRGVRNIARNIQDQRGGSVFSGQK